METKAWKKLLCKYLREDFKRKMIDNNIQTKRHLSQLSRPVENLEDVRCAMGCLSVLRDAEVQNDMTLIFVEV